MTEPVFWLGLSVGLVAVAILAVILTLLPAVIQLGRAAQSVERFFDTLLRELPPTLEALRLTSLEVSEIADSLDEGVKGGRTGGEAGEPLPGRGPQASPRRSGQCPQLLGRGTGGLAGAVQRDSPHRHG